jgi:hypothetical protein
VGNFGEARARHHRKAFVAAGQLFQWLSFDLFILMNTITIKMTRKWTVQRLSTAQIRLQSIILQQTTDLHNSPAIFLVLYARNELFLQPSHYSTIRSKLASDLRPSSDDTNTHFASRQTPILQEILAVHGRTHNGTDPGRGDSKIRRQRLPELGNGASLPNGSPRDADNPRRIRS